jgi:hypothetical protein
MSDTSPTPDFEGLLRRALAPVEPPDDFALRIEQTLQAITDIAAEELEGWEVGAMRDPRNWPTVARPVAAVAVGSAAGAALVVLRVRAGRKRRPSDPIGYVDHTVRAAVHEVRRLLDR